MTNPVNATGGCLLVGEYVDEADGPTDCAAGRGEAVRPRVVADHLDVWAHDDSLREFTVLLKDGRVVAVRGHRLTISPPAFGIVIRAGGEDEIVALFKSDDVHGIFHGEIRPDRMTA